VAMSGIERDNASLKGVLPKDYDRVLIFNEEFEPSKILYQMAPEPYRIYLAEFQPEQQEEEGSTSEDKSPRSSG
jgi:hypothetical protein